MYCGRIIERTKGPMTVNLSQITAVAEGHAVAEERERLGVPALPPPDPAVIDEFR
jgi:hypothetical protein